MPKEIQYNPGEGRTPRGPKPQTGVKPQVTSLALTQLVPAAEVRKLMIQGVVKEDAVRLVAAMNGIGVKDGVVDISWTLKQVNNLLFLKQLVSRGLVSDND